MKLLIVTQAIDIDDPILGFFHHWVEMLAPHFERIEVICLKMGRHALPENVYVHSLGKKDQSPKGVIDHAVVRFWYTTRFGRLIWKLRPDYDAVLVHMNPEYLMLGGIDWRLMGKKITFWYNHPHNDWRLKLAAFFASTIFYTSPYSATAKLKKAVRMPAGIDTDIFKPQPVVRNRHALYMQGRITPSKHIEVALAALKLVRQEISDATLTLVGPEDKAYGEKLRKDFADVMNAVDFSGPKRNDETPTLYSAHGASINLAAAGHYDKSVLESMACETPVVLTSAAFAGLVPPEWVTCEGDTAALAVSLIRLMKLPDAEYAALGEEERAAVQTESLDTLVDKLVTKLAL